MRKEQMSQIMKRAHENAREFRSSCASYKEALAKGLKNAWALFKANGIVKTMEDIKNNAKNNVVVTVSTAVKNVEVVVKGWFLTKNFNQNERYVINTANETIIERETEKAVLVKFVADDATVKSWIPKSCCTINA